MGLVNAKHTLVLSFLRFSSLSVLIFTFSDPPRFFNLPHFRAENGRRTPTEPDFRPVAGCRRVRPCPTPGPGMIGPLSHVLAIANEDRVRNFGITRENVFLNDIIKWRIPREERAG